MKRAVIDTNIFISYLIGKKLKALDVVLKEKKAVLIMSRLQLEELENVVKREKFKKVFSTSKVRELLANIDSIAEIVEVTSHVTICRDAKDNYLLAMAKDGEANYMVSGDDDLLALKIFGETKIIPFTEFIAIIKNQT